MSRIEGTPTQIAKVLNDRIQMRINRYTPTDPRFKESMYRIGYILEGQIKRNIISQKIVDSGRLINSISFRINQQGTKTLLTAGSYGVPYAAMNEYGGTFTERQRRAMFASLRDSGRLRKGYMGKGIIKGNHWKARPYMKPAIKQQKGKILEILRNLYRI